MATVKRIVCLANSRKVHGRCIAGKEYGDGRPGGWVRPVSARWHEEVSESERQYEDGTEPRLLDIVDVPLLEARPSGYQQENWLLDGGRQWTKAGRAAPGDLMALVDPAGPLWFDGHSTYYGENDQIPLTLASAIRDSLRLVMIDRLTLYVGKPGEAFGNPKRRVLARFSLAGAKYGLWVTDPVCESKYLAKPDGGSTLGPSFLTVSLSEPHKGHCYKLVAAIIEIGEGAGK